MKQALQGHRAPRNIRWPNPRQCVLGFCSTTMVLFLAQGLCYRSMWCGEGACSGRGKGDNYSSFKGDTAFPAIAGNPPTSDLQSEPIGPDQEHSRAAVHGCGKNDSQP